MNCIPLPDELVRKVYGYILPIFDYVAYVKALTNHEAEEESLEHLINQRNNVTDIQDRIDYNDIIVTYTCLMNVDLYIIRDFLKDNPLFERPVHGAYLTDDQYKWRGSIVYCKNQVERMEHTIGLRRGRRESVVGADGNNHTILIYHKLEYMLKHGSLETIFHNCLANNINVISEPYADMQRRAAGWLMNDDYRNYLVKLLIKV